ncbi:hypothetical protein [Comamonas odontotermitis]|uniref:hypothetical protein n=1 Tax=Comamonas odontotermitis TaxID=379895 RepID=UPI001CC38BCF|nr:hypothetical protein [Comamonas odontotermitis]UBB15409.1 hypothetical protein LAD35_11040 [Comamonas odontotermitis]
MAAQTPLKLTPTSGTTGELREFAAGDFLGIAAGGTGVSAGTVADVRTALGLGSAAVAPILGTVSQSGGVPTGAIVQRGSNANGEFVRFADGTMICQHSFTESLNLNTQASGFYFATQGWTFPATFAVAPQVIPQTRIGSQLTPMAPGDSTTTLCNFFPLALSSQSGTATTRVTAIGRWF